MFITKLRKIKKKEIEKIKIKKIAKYYSVTRLINRAIADNVLTQPSNDTNVAPSDIPVIDRTTPNSIIIPNTVNIHPNTEEGALTPLFIAMTPWSSNRNNPKTVGKNIGLMFNVNILN